MVRWVDQFIEKIGKLFCPHKGGVSFNGLNESPKLLIYACTLQRKELLLELELSLLTNWGFYVGNSGEGKLKSLFNKCIFLPQETLMLSAAERQELAENAMEQLAR